VWRDALRWLVLGAATALVALQLFVPPIVGLSDQGDFRRMIGRFGYGPEDKLMPLTAGFVQAKYVPDPSSRIPAFEQAGPEYLFVGSAIALNRLISKDGSLDIRMIGFVHAVAFLAAFVWLLRVTGPLTWMVALIALTDIGYVAYWNSFYTEPATCIAFLLLAAESVGMCRGKISTMQLGRWCLWAALLVWAKSSNYPLAMVLAPFALYLGWRAKNMRLTGILGACAIAAMAIVTMWTRPKPMQQATTYDSIFMAILPESHTPAEDLKELGLDPSLVSFSGSGAWTERTAFPTLYGGVLLHDVTGATVARFYLRHPTRIWRRARSLMPVAFSFRPEWCGNFESSARRPPGAKTQNFTLWSWFHERILGRIGRFLLIALAISPVIFMALRFRFPARAPQFEFVTVLSACALIAFLTAACGDAWDNVKHMFLFNLLLDAWLISVVQFARL
jgi:hypothetical protein